MDVSIKVCIFFLWAGLLQADVIERQSFKLPLGKSWKCQKQVGKSKSCKHNNKDWVLVVTEDDVNGPAQLLVFMSKLKKPRKLIVSKDKTKESKVISGKYVTVQNKKFVEALHMDAEIPGYHTHYLAGIVATHGLVISLSSPPKDKSKASKEVESLKKKIQFLK